MSLGEHLAPALELINAVEDKDLEKVAELLERGANANEADLEGHTPLMILIKNIFGEPPVEMIRLLMNAGADPYKRNNDGHDSFYLLEDSYVENYIWPRPESWGEAEDLLLRRGKETGACQKHIMASNNQRKLKAIAPKVTIRGLQS